VVCEQEAAVVRKEKIKNKNKVVAQLKIEGQCFIKLKHVMGNVLGGYGERM
jgi:hypothetical protein